MTKTSGGRGEGGEICVEQAIFEGPPGHPGEDGQEYVVNPGRGLRREVRWSH